MVLGSFKPRLESKAGRESAERPCSDAHNGNHRQHNESKEMNFDLTMTNYDDGVSDDGVKNQTQIIKIKTIHGEEITIVVSNEGTEILVADETIFES